MLILPRRTHLSKWAGIAALAAVIPWLQPLPLAAACVGSQRPPQRFEATIEACRSPEWDIRIALEPSRKSYEDWVAALPYWMRAYKSFDQMVQRRLVWPEVIVRLRIKDYGQFSADPERWEKIRASMQGDPIAPSEPKEYLLRLKAGGCESIRLQENWELVEDVICCDVQPPVDNACLLNLPSAQLVLQQ